MNQNKTIGTLADVLSLIDQTGLTGTRRRDMISAINRICEMAGTTPECMCAELPVLKEMLSRIGPAAHGVSAKSYSNLRSLLAAALELAGVIDPSGRGRAIRHPQWGPLLQTVADDQRLSNGLARLRELVRRSGHLTGGGRRQRRSAIPDVAGGQDTPPEAT